MTEPRPTDDATARATTEAALVEPGQTPAQPVPAPGGPAAQVSSAPTGGGLLERFDALLGGEWAGPFVLAIAALLFAAYRLIDLSQAGLKHHGWQLSPSIDPGLVRDDLLAYYLVGAGALVLYLVLFAATARGSVTGHVRSAILALGVGLHLGVALTAPALSTDAISYLAHGAVGTVVPGGTAYTTLSEVLIGTPFGDQLVGLGWAPPPILSPYAPLWTLIERVLVAVAPTAALGVVLVKLVAIAAVLASARLVWLILGLVRPRLQLAGTSLFLWNPVILVELSLEGHNDGLMAAFGLLSIYLVLRARPAAALVAATLGVLVKYVSAIFVPPLAIHLWRTAADRPALVRAAGLGALTSAALAIGLFAPVWAGTATFVGLEQSGVPGGYGTLPGALFRFLTLSVPGVDAGLVAVVVPALLFLAFVAIQSARVRGRRSLLAALGWIAVAYLLLARGLYYPWYAVLAISVLVLSPDRRFVAILVVVTAVARVVAPLVDLAPAAYPFAVAPFIVTNAGSFVTLGVFAWLWGRSVPGEEDAAEASELAAATATGPTAGEAVGAPGADGGSSAEVPTTDIPADTAPAAPAGGLLPPAVTVLAARLVAAARDDGRPRSLLERLLLVALVAIPMVATGIALLPEILVRVPSMNDDMLHWLFIRNADETLGRGANVLDHWLPQIETGVPQFLFYQHLAPLLVVALGRLSGGLVDLFDWFNIVRWVLLTTLPLTVLWSMRRMGFGLVAAAIAAGVAPLLASGGLYGFDYDSYLWRGWGLFTQLLAMHLSFVVLATAHRAITSGKGIALAAIAFAALVLAHLIYAYMLGITLVALLLIGIDRENAPARLVRFGLVASIGAAISAYMWLPFLGSSAYLNATPYLQDYKYDSYGAGEILRWLATGQLFDVGRAPILTALFGAGVLAALAGRRRPAVVALVLAGLWLVLYSGRPTLGPIADLLPMSDGLLFHRFVGAVHLVAIVLMGVGGAMLWSLLTADGSRQGLAVGALALVLVLLPTLQERLDYYAANTTWMERSAAAVDNDRDAAAILTRLRELPPGRVYAGLPDTYADQLKLDAIPFSSLFPYEGITALPPATESMSLNSDLIWDFDESSRGSYDLFNVRYVVAPTGRSMADFLTPLMTAGRYTLYEAPTTGYGRYVRFVDRAPVASQAGLFARNRAWAGSPLPADGYYAAHEYPSRKVVADGYIAPICTEGDSVTETAVGDDRFEFRVTCAMESGFVIKTTYHPNWRVLVDGEPVATFMASPSYIGFVLPAGDHEVVATYEPTPIKTPLALAGIAFLLLAILLRRRLDRFPDALVAAIRRLVRAIERQLEKERLTSGRRGLDPRFDPAADPAQEAGA